MNIELQATHVVGRIKNVTTVNGNTVSKRKKRIHNVTPL